MLMVMELPKLLYLIAHRKIMVIVLHLIVEVLTQADL
jgi:hypothetical protein